MTSPNRDQEKAEAFAGRMVSLLNEASLALMTSIGHRTGLFDAMAGLAPSTSAAIAEAAGLNERYVREWLGAMVTGRIVDLDATKGTYVLPPEHATALTRAAGPDNMATYAQLIPLLGSVEEAIVESFRNGGGVPYSAYPQFQEVMADESAQNLDASLIDKVLPLIPGMVERLGSGIDVLDVGCGRGHAINLMAEAFPESRFVGYDLSEEGITNAKDEAAQRGLANARFEVRDVAKRDEARAYGLITAFDAIHDQAYPRRVLKGIAGALQPNGTFLMVDVKASSQVHENLDLPFGPLAYTVSCMHCMTVSLSQGGEGLGAMWGEEKAQQLLAEAGFTKVQIEQIPTDLFNNYYIASAG
jgi:2-polyprenyl-3-methyl-5-hydroxy-6-metoxy-1,4-benzoquinol methylase